MSKNRVLHISTECYPVAKAGGMADVVGSLPIFLKKKDWIPCVITPKYDLPWYRENKLRKIFSDSFDLEGSPTNFSIYKSKKSALPFDYYCVDIPERFGRDSIYLNEHGHGFYDEAERNVSFQRSVLSWLSKQNENIKIDLIHCHDHQVGFIPFLLKNAEAYSAISHIPCFYTIHNGAYNSRYPWNRVDLMPTFKEELRPTIDWDDHMDASVAAFRFADHVNTVSPSYLAELKSDIPSLALISQEHPSKFSGTLNGIDQDVWDPKTDDMLSYHLARSVDQFKAANKGEILRELYHLKGIPLISFIGRFAHQKGGDLLVPSIERILSRFGFVNFYILGSGDRFIEHQVQELRDRFSERVACYIGYNEALAHKIYAASDFIVMPSRFEPCGLNQMFAMRYGALVVARSTGGLKDTVIDHESGGLGISFDYDSIDDLTNALTRALYLYRNQKHFKKLRTKAMKVDFSWNKSAEIYSDIYNQLLKDS